MQALYLLLVTNKASNILEDLETLRLLSKVTPEYVSSLEEEAICRAAFDLLFAFDEVISLGYKEQVTVTQVKQNTEVRATLACLLMLTPPDCTWCRPCASCHSPSCSHAEACALPQMESHEERLHKMIIQSKINETKDVMKRKAMEIDKSKLSDAKLVCCPTSTAHHYVNAGLDASQMQRCPQSLQLTFLLAVHRARGSAF